MSMNNKQGVSAFYFVNVLAVENFHLGFSSALAMYPILSDNIWLWVWLLVLVVYIIIMFIIIRTELPFSYIYTTGLHIYTTRSAQARHLAQCDHDNWRHRGAQVAHQIPADMPHNNVIIASKQRRFDVIMTLLHRVPAGILQGCLR